MKKIDLPRPRRNRRRFLFVLLAVCFAGGFIVFYTIQIEPHWIEYVHRPLPVRNLPPALEGKILIQLSDLHAGFRVSDNYLKKVFKKVRSLNPDVIVVTGDFFDGNPRAFNPAARVLAELPRGRLASIGILGNHDYARNWSDKVHAARCVEVLKAAGYQILRNDTAEVQGLLFAGLDDYWSPCFNAAPLLSRLRPDDPIIVLCHNPDVLDLPVWGMFRGWVLCGHTHGGQCRVPFCPPPCLPVKNGKYAAGEIRLADGRRAYVNRGVGHLLRARFLIRPEVTVFTLEKDQADFDRP